MKYVAGVKLLERKIILHYILKAGDLVTMPEILLLRGIPVIKKSKLSREDQQHYTSIATSTRHLMSRLCKEGLVSVDKEQFSFWSLHFALTSKGKKEAEECQEFLSYINALQVQETRTLDARSQTMRALSCLPEGKVPGNIAEQPSIKKGSLQVKSEPKPPIVHSREDKPVPKVSSKPPSVTPKIVTKAPAKSAVKAIVPAQVTPKIAPHPPISVPLKPMSKMLRCPTCGVEFPISSVKRQLERHDGFECDCGTVLTEKALELIDVLAIGA